MKIITTAFPFVPAELGIHHFASTYLPADIYCRSLKIMGEKVLFVNATDFHSIYATDNGKIDIDKCYKYHDSYIRNYKAINISFDRLLTTDNEIHLQTINDAILKLQKDKLLYEKNALVVRCCCCGMFLPDKFIVKNHEKKVCSLCGSNNLSYQYSLHTWLDLKNNLDIVNHVKEKFSQVEVVNQINQFLKNLSDWDFTRDNKFGVKYNDQLTIYLWFESLIGYYSLVPTDYKQNANFVHFIGKNIIYYHGIVWPVILKHISNGCMRIDDISVRGFMSANSKIDLSVDKLCSKYGVDSIRFYIAYKVRDTISDFSLREEEIRKVVCEKLINNCIHFINRVRGLLASDKTIKLESEEAFICEIEKKYIEPVCDDFKKTRINSALKKIIEFATAGNVIISNMVKISHLDISNLSYMANAIILLLHPIVPQTSKELQLFRWEGEMHIKCIESMMTSRIIYEPYRYNFSIK